MTNGDALTRDTGLMVGGAMCVLLNLAMFPSADGPRIFALVVIVIGLLVFLYGLADYLWIQKSMRRNDIDGGEL